MVGELDLPPEPARARGGRREAHLLRLGRAPPRPGRHLPPRAQEPRGRARRHRVGPARDGQSGEGREAPQVVSSSRRERVVQPRRAVSFSSFLSLVHPATIPCLERSRISCPLEESSTSSSTRRAYLRSPCSPCELGFDDVLSCSPELERGSAPSEPDGAGSAASSLGRSAAGASCRCSPARSSSLLGQSVAAH